MGSYRSPEHSCKGSQRAGVMPGGGKRGREEWEHYNAGELRCPSCGEYVTRDSKGLLAEHFRPSPSEVVSEYVRKHRGQFVCTATVLGLVVLGLISWVALVVMLFVFGPPTLIVLSLCYDNWNEQRVMRWTGRPSPPPKHTFGVGQANRNLNADYWAWKLAGHRQQIEIEEPLINREYFNWMLESNKRSRCGDEAF